MNDPIETAQQARHAAEAGAAIGAGGMLGAVGVIGALTKLWTSVFGTRKERADAKAAEAAPNERAADLAIRIAEDEREEIARTRHRAETCEERLAAMGVRLDGMEARLRAAERDHAPCAARIAHLESEQQRSRDMLADLMRTGNTPPLGLYRGEDVRAAMTAQEDDHG